MRKLLIGSVLLLMVGFVGCGSGGTGPVYTPPDPSVVGENGPAGKSRGADAAGVISRSALTD